MAENHQTLLNQQFQEELQKLNSQQKEAVHHIEGPVMVIAGPGTGKTHILTARIGQILQETDTQAYNILCLTFTDAGAHVMRERLLQFIGPAAHQVHIFTFHSFCNKVIQENLELFGIQNLEPLNDLEKVELIRQLIDQLPNEHPLKRGRRDIYFYEKHLHNLFQMMKKENWTPQYLHQRIKAYLEDLPKRQAYIYQRNTGRFQKGNLKEGKLQKERERMERLWAAASLFDEYAHLLRKNRRYDYEDMLLWVIREFGRYEKLLRFYQEQYLYILVDEYQDTSGAQNQILQLLIQYWKNPNVFIVGDDDQSIYEFQGARLKNITDFYAAYQEDLKTIVLQKNYRSSQAILDMAKVLIDKNENRIAKVLGVEKNIIAANPLRQDTIVSPQIIAYSNRVQEETAILNQIKKWYQRGVAYEEIAVIYARHRQASNLIGLLEKSGIPYQTKRKVNILDLPLIENLRTLLEYIQLEYRRVYTGEHLLYQILHFNFLDIPASDIFILSKHLANDAEKKWRDSIGDVNFLESLQLNATNQIIRLSSLLNELITDYRNIPLPFLIERLINRSGLLKYILNQSNQAWGLQVLTTLMDFIRAEVSRKPRVKLEGVLETLSKMDANFLTVDVQKTEQAWAGVNFVTAHSAKGMEFKVVFIIDAVKDYWEPNKVAPFQFPLPDTLTYSSEEDALEARRRLFYVALTRAKEYLHVSYSKASNNGKPLQRTQFIDEITIKYPIDIQEKQVSSAALINSYRTALLETPAPQIQPLQTAIVEDLLKDFKLSISALNAYLRCPLSFYYEKVLRVPTVNSEAAAYGSAIHHALMVLFEKMRRSRAKKFPNLKAFLSYFNQELKRQYGYFSEKEFKRRLELGRSNLSRIYTTYLPNWHKNVQTEVPIKNVVVASVPLTGIIDKIELYKDYVHIVDYKTGSQNPSKFSAPTKTRPYGGNYWRQLIFYKILYEAQRYKNLKALSGEIVYIDSDSAGELTTRKTIFEEGDVQLVRQLIVDTYQKIQAHDFYTGCGESNCLWCNFVKRNLASDSFSILTQEELDDKN